MLHSYSYDGAGNVVRIVTSKGLDTFSLESVKSSPANSSPCQPPPKYMSKRSADRTLRRGTSLSEQQSPSGIFHQQLERGWEGKKGPGKKHISCCVIIANDFN